MLFKMLADKLLAKIFADKFFAEKILADEVFADKMLVKKRFAEKVLAKFTPKFNPNEREFSQNSRLNRLNFPNRHA